MEPGIAGEGNVQDTDQTAWEGRLHVQSTEVKPVWKHRARVTAGLATAQTKAREDDRRWRAELGHVATGLVELLLQFAQTEFGRTQSGFEQREASITAEYPAWEVAPCGLDGGGHGLGQDVPTYCRVQINTPRLLVRLDMFWRDLGGPVAAADGAIVETEGRGVHWAPFSDDPFEAKGEEQRPQGGRPVQLSSGSGFSPARPRPV